MIRLVRTRAFRTHPRAQRGVALVVALILLLVATIVGLAASRGTVLQERMSSNTYDRSLAFQRSEAALRAAEIAITAEWRIVTLGGVDCSGAIACAIVPTNAFTGTSATWTNVPADFNVNSALAPGMPQYFIAFMGTGRSESNLGQTENANNNQYGGGGAPDNVAYFRVTARSSDPTTLNGRSIVVLQTTVKRAM